VSKTLQAIRGMNDILPGADAAVALFRRARSRACWITYGYRQIRMPIVEFTELFKRSIGEVTDIVEKEMYTFDDRNGDSLTLRPEGTAGCVRAGDRARSYRWWPAAEALVHRPDVPPRAPAERPLPAVPPDRCRGVQPRWPGHRRRADHDDLAPVGPARHAATQVELAAQFSLGHQRIPRSRIVRCPGRVSVLAHL
jgi:hypothetical protein